MPLLLIKETIVQATALGVVVHVACITDEVDQIEKRFWTDENKKEIELVQAADSSLAKKCNVSTGDMMDIIESRKGMDVAADY